MAHSYIDYRSNTARLNDQLLSIVVLIGVDLVQHSSKWEDAKGLIESWADAVLDAPAGLIEIDLSGFWETNSGSKLISNWLDAIEDRVSKFGDKVPGDYLNGLANAAAIRFIDTDTNLIIKEINKWKELITG